ncbi:glutamate synthase-related protein [Kineosporia mesophila]|uniref:Glutamate synthase-related protein n=1 Tax=Kineosporia mesophila TaxID=566012 RepID=A0ABP6ZAG0_9ACTN|nr:glutamate synthase-related protein [Kineosporia mesophila]MCD5352133.1 alpha-hydroxy-acid oxidizing protein [Kineosporia mesophila]
MTSSSPNILRAEGFPAEEIRRRARLGARAVFPDASGYGADVFGEVPTGNRPDALDRLRILPPLFTPRRLEKLIELGREPMPADVDLRTDIGGLPSAFPLYLSALGSTKVASTRLGAAAARQAAQLGIPMVIGENIAPVNGYRGDDDSGGSMRRRISAYTGHLNGDLGGVLVQQSTEDADAEVWNQIYSDPETGPILMSGRLGFELKLGQGAKPGLGGMTLVDRDVAEAMAGRYAFDPAFDDGPQRLRCSAPGTFDEEILRQQIRLMRNNFPRARVGVKLFPGRDVATACAVAWEAGADSVTVDGAEGGSGWAPTVMMRSAGLPLADCLARISPAGQCLCVSGRMWEGARAVRCLALGARAVGLGRAALIAVDEDPDAGLIRLVSALTFEMRLLISALGKYAARDLASEDVGGDLVPEPGYPVGR